MCCFNNLILWDSSCHCHDTLPPKVIGRCGVQPCLARELHSVGDKKGKVFRRSQEEWDLNLIGGKYYKSSITFASIRSWFCFSLALNVFITLTRVLRPLLTQDVAIIWSHPQPSTPHKLYKEFLLPFCPLQDFLKCLALLSSQFFPSWRPCLWVPPRSEHFNAVEVLGPNLSMFVCFELFCPGMYWV